MPAWLQGLRSVASVVTGYMLFVMLWRATTAIVVKLTPESVWYSGSGEAMQPTQNLLILTIALSAPAALMGALMTARLAGRAFRAHGAALAGAIVVMALFSLKYGPYNPDALKQNLACAVVAVIGVILGTELKR